MTTGHKQGVQRMSHPHKELIHAWADGCIIQYLCGGQWFECNKSGPTWDIKTEYRIKPEPKPDYSKFGGLYEGDGYNEIQGVTSDINKVPQESTDASGHWTLVNKLELIFDGETKELKDVKIHGKEVCASCGNAKE